MEKKLRQELLNDMYIEIRSLEAENLKTGKYSDSQMVQKIANIIARHANDEVKKK